MPDASGVDAADRSDATTDVGRVVDTGLDTGGACAMPDHDSDGERSISCGGSDCDDEDPARFPGHTEVCDAADRDEDCDPTTFGFRDADGDGFADAACCNVDGASEHCGTDCDDARPGAHPTAPEVCNGFDDDCDMATDEGVGTVYHHDADGDGYGSPTGTTMSACSAPATYVEDATDCDDSMMSVHPGATEVCNAGVDDNCDTVADPGCTCTTGDSRDCGTPDGMGGFLMRGICTIGSQRCTGGFWEAGCMGATLRMVESCNAADDDCDGATDEGTILSCYVDADGDGFAAPGAPSITACTCGAGRTATPPATGTSDCDDTSSSRNPATAEVCNGVDDNCNTMVDEGALQTYYADCDSDGYGGAMTTMACSAPPGIPTGCSAGSWNTSSGDCNDMAASVHPLAAEPCNGTDDDCNGTIDGAPATAACNASMPAGVASSTCTSGACVVSSCSASRYDCNGGADCEVACTGCAGTCSWVCGHGACADAPIELAAGGSLVCARTAGGVSCWGDDYVGQTGDGGPTGTDHAVPVRVLGLTDAIDIAVTKVSGCAVRASGSVVCWGANTYGQLGDGVTPRTDPCGECTSTPVGVVGITDAIQVAAGGDTHCALHAGGTVSCWGSDGRGQLGDGSGTTLSGCAFSGLCSTTPVSVMGLTDAVEVVGGVGGTGSGHFCARRSGGAVVCWGYDSFGQLGDGGVGTGRSPVVVTGLTDAIHLAAGGSHTCAIRAGGSVTCWGDNRDGQIGGVGTSSSTPRAVAGVTDAVEIAAGGENTCVRRATGSLLCWGDNEYGQIGDGTVTDRSAPTPVMGITSATTLAIGGNSPSGGAVICAIQLGAVLCWGDDGSGQLGDNRAMETTCATTGVCWRTPVGVTAPP
jgi:alpha-tubulin suppressor-like RCC1 family protein